MLLCQRSFEREWHPGVWDLPGGHVVGEAARDALLRELQEELGIIADLDEECSRVLENEDARVSIWTVESWSGDLRNNDRTEHASVEWISPARALSLELGPLASHLFGPRPANDRPIIRHSSIDV